MYIGSMATVDQHVEFRYVETLETAAGPLQLLRYIWRCPLCVCLCVCVRVCACACVCARARAYVCAG